MGHSRRISIAVGVAVAVLVAIGLAASSRYTTAARPQLRGAAGPQLRYVVIVSRHGVRSPLWDASRLRRYSAQPWPQWDVAPGNLTPHGRTLITRLGAYYRERFTGERLLDAGKCADAARVYVWSDTDQRTLETSRALAESILPGCGVEIHSQPAGKRDPLFGEDTASQMEEAMQAIRVRWNNRQILDKHRAALKVLNGILGRPENQSMELSTASTLSENLLLEFAGGMRGADLGWGRLSKENLLQTLELHRAYSDAAWKHRDAARARGGALLAAILRSIAQSVTGSRVDGALGDAKSALLFLAGHDTNQASLAGMLGLVWSLPGYQPGETPPGGALVFSLWSDDGRYYVRTEFLAQTLDQMHDAMPLTLKTPPETQMLLVPGCPNDPAGCPWEKFREIVAAAGGHS